MSFHHRPVASDPWNLLSAFQPPLNASVIALWLVGLSDGGHTGIGTSFLKHKSVRESLSPAHSAYTYTYLPPKIVKHGTKTPYEALG